MKYFFSVTSGIGKNIVSKIIPYISITVLTYTVIRYSTNIKKSKYEKTIRYSFISFMLILELLFYFWAFFYHSNLSIKYYLIRMLPLHLSTIALYLTIIVGITKNEKLFRFCFYLALMGPIFTILGGKIEYSYDRFRYWHYYQEHINTFILAIYMMFVHNLKIYKGDWIRALLILSIIGTFIALPFNILLGTNFMYIYNYENSPLIIFDNKVTAYLVALFSTAICFNIIELVFIKNELKK